MISLFSNNPLYLITNRKISGLTHTRIARRAIAAGIKTIQLREKHLPKKEIYKEALSIREITGRHKVTFIINDYIDIALAVDADGVHLGQEDMPLKEAGKILGKKKIIGISTHTLRQAIEARDAGADYIGFGPMFHTTTKDAGRPKGIKALREISKHVNIPVIAIGGITWDNVNEVLNSGADAAAVASGILSGDIKANLKRFFEAMT
ncbi:thiamine-phosphate synthase [bacterium BMS3Abin06]|nr:thiamine-phosphate synthase [bacterium BMS3Abin06]